MKKLLPLLSLLATGCGDCVPVRLTPDEQAWVNVYQAGQRLTFRSNRGATNVLTVQPLKEWHDNQDCNQLEAGKYQPIRTTLVLTSATAYSSDAPSFSLLAYKTNPDRPAQLTFTLAGLLCQATDPPGGPNPKLVKLKPQAITLGGRSYPAAQLVRNGLNGTIYMGNSQLRAAWWDQHAGLLRYELASGEVFDLTAE
ncbi:MAG: hypothetical protein ACRYFZ_27305 [Janthinobacterium lividum]